MYSARSLVGGQYIQVVLNKSMRSQLLQHSGNPGKSNTVGLLYLQIHSLQIPLAINVKHLKIGCILPVISHLGVTVRPEGLQF